MCFAAEVSRCAKECFFLISSPASGALCWTTVFLDYFDGPARPARGRGNEEAVVGAARPEQFHDWARFRGWTLPVFSAAKNGYVRDYFAREDAGDPALASMMNAFKKTPEGIFHTWGSELVGHPMENGHPRHVDAVWLYWNLLDMTREGRGQASIPRQSYEHKYFTKHVYGGE